MPADPTRTILLDDGLYLLSVSDLHQGRFSFGELECRCPIMDSAPRGVQCVGAFFVGTDGQWTARIAAPFDRATFANSMVVAASVSRLDAIVATWHARHRAARLYDAPGNGDRDRPNPMN